MSNDGKVLNTLSEGVPVMGVNGFPPGLGPTRFLQTDTNGNLNVNVLSGGTGGSTLKPFEFFNNSTSPWAFTGGNFVLDISPAYPFTLDSIYVKTSTNIISFQLKDMVGLSNIFFRSYGAGKNVPNFCLYNINSSASNEILSGANTKFNFIIVPINTFGTATVVVVIRK